MTSLQKIAATWRSSDDEGLIMEAARSDLSQFTPLYERYVSRIYAYCLRRVDDPQEAEDLTSQVFTRALTAIESYRGGLVAAWLFRIAHNIVVDYLRSRYPQVPIEELDLEDDSVAPIERLMQDEDYQVLQKLVSTLPDDQQDLLALKMASGLTTEEIARIVGKSPGAVRVNLHRIIKYLYGLSGGLR
jgi:RNA polymerase sigma-70 factor, ECF subfamily